jgi:hypothetical protein
MEQSHIDANSRLASQNIPRLLRDPKVHTMFTNAWRWSLSCASYIQFTPSDSTSLRYSLFLQLAIDIVVYLTTLSLAQII